MRLLRLLVAAGLCLWMLAPCPIWAQDMTVSLNAGWRFTRGDPAGAQNPAFDAAAWSPVSVPHTWNADDWQVMTGYYRGPGWYRRPLDVPAAWKGRRIFIRFDAASTAADVFVNGRSIGQHHGAFGAFAFEITDAITVGGPNLLAVRVSNEKRDDIPPLGGDFNLFGGLYRRVTLFARDPICLSPLDFASPGVAVRQVAVSDARADLDVTARVSNGTDRPVSVAVIVRVLNAEGELAAAVRTTVVVAPGAMVPVSQPMTLVRPHLWNGVADPYLHTVRVEVRSGGSVRDRVSQPLGVRFYRIDPVRGFFLNGRTYPLHGVNRHQDREGLGWALTEQAQDEDMGIIRELGANTVRLAHYQHNDYFYALCDRAGIVAWAEVPLVNEVNTSDAFAANAKQQLTELIRQNINHPSIIVWSVYNEVGLHTRVDPTSLIKALNALAKSEDATRPTVAATSQGELGRFVEMVATPDLIAANLYPGWYSATPDDMGPLLDQWNAHYGSKGLAVSEYGAGASPRQHEQGMTNRPTPTGKWHPEEWQAIQHERNYAAIVARPFVWASWVWNLFDFASSGRSEGDLNGINDKGLVSYDRTLKKDAFYFYKANWNPEPMVYLTSRRHTTRTEAVTTVKAYSTCPSVTLRVNGTAVGVATGSSLHVFTWQGVTLAPGENVIALDGRCQDRAVHDEARWTLAPEIRPDPFS